MNISKSLAHNTQAFLHLRAQVGSLIVKSSFLILSFTLINSFTIDSFQDKYCSSRPCSSILARVSPSFNAAYTSSTFLIGTIDNLSTRGSFSSIRYFVSHECELPSKSVIISFTLPSTKSVSYTVSLLLVITYALRKAMCIAKAISCIAKSLLTSFSYGHSKSVCYRTWVNRSILLSSFVSGSKPQAMTL